MKILISAAETSSDTHGACLLRELRRLAPPGTQVEAFGVGGPRLQAEGLRTVVDARDLLAMGFTEVLARLPRILRGLKRVQTAAETERPELAVVIDYPEFHFKLARRLFRSGIPAVYYIPPKIWVWRRSRLKFLRRYFRMVLCILPFEEPFYREGGLSVRYVGNPLLDELPLSLSKAEAREKMGMAPDAHVLALLPGSRPGELARHFELFLDGADLASRQAGLNEVEAPIPLPATVDAAPWQARLEAWKLSHSGSPLRPRIVDGQAWEILRAADAGIVKSGTSTLEAGLLGCPHVVVYKPAALTGFLFRHLVRYRGPVGLVNLIGGWRAGDVYFFKEVLMGAATPENVAAETAQLLRAGARRDQLTAASSQLRARLGEADATGRGPSARAAQAILDLVAEHGGSP
ncbi:MAG TPA: lipid-A-disaccharide synthase [Bdellovibrionota bacterium]|jgi:lipid-A-disaccharide synthase|nr:lipid-A-disaccharide synthase [Bdellovibrionota bacterium]